MIYEIGLQHTPHIPAGCERQIPLVYGAAFVKYGAIIV